MATGGIKHSLWCHEQPALRSMVLRFSDWGTQGIHYDQWLRRIGWFNETSQCWRGL